MDFLSAAKVVRKNLALTALLVVMLLATYFGIELPNRQQHAQENLFNVQHLGALVGIQGPNFYLEKRQEQFWLRSSNVLASTLLVENFLSTLEKIRLVKEIAPPANRADDRLFFPDPNQRLTFHFAQGQLEFIVGNKLHHSTEFYLQVHENEKILPRWLIVEVDIPLEGFYQQEQARSSDEKFLKVLSWLAFTDEQWREMRLLPDGPKKISKVQVENWRNRTFVVDFVAQQVTPNPVPTAPLDPQKILSYQEQLGAIQAQQIYLGVAASELQQQIAQLQFTWEGGEGEQWRLGKKFRHQYGYFLYARGNIYQLNSDAVLPFFASAQDFLIKQIFSVMPAELQVLVSGRPPLHLTWKAAEASTQQIFRYLIKSADYLSAIESKTSPAPAGNFAIIVGQEEFLIFFQAHELVISALARQINFHFAVAKDSLIDLNFVPSQLTR